MRQQRSPFISPFGDVRDCLIEAQFDSVAALDAIEHLIHWGVVGEASQFVDEILLKRSAISFGSPLEFFVDVGWDISDQNVRHAYIMQACDGMSRPVSWGV
jgi:hypothetical protein